MKIQAYCSHCKKTSFIDVEEEELTAHISQETPVPAPSTQGGSSGLLQRSLSHGDHILLIEIDRNGVIRKQKVVYLISSVIENIIAQAVENTIEINSKIMDNTRTLLYISNSKAFSDFFKSVLSILILNVENADMITTKINSNYIEFKFNNLKLIHLNETHAFELLKKEVVHSIVIDLDTTNEDSVLRQLPFSKIHNSRLILAYNSRKYETTPTKLLNFGIKTGITGISLYDYATGVGLNNIINESYKSIGLI